MEARNLGFIVVVLIGIFFEIIGLLAFHAKKPVGFWANAVTAPIENVKAYNRAVGKLWCVFGVVFVLLGLPMLAGQNSPGILFSVIGIMFEVIAVMVVYMRIENKYRKK